MGGSTLDERSRNWPCAHTCDCSTTWLGCKVRLAVRSRRARGRLSGVDINPEVLRQARVAAGLSLAQVGGTELTRQAVHLIETGKVRPSMRSLRVLASRLGVPVASLLAPV